MSGSVSALRARVEALMLGSAGVSPWVVGAGLFHASTRELELCERTSIERAFTAHIDRAAPLEPVNTLSGYALYERRLRVRIGYVLTETGDESEYEAAGEQSGASVHEAVEDRADADGILVRAVIGSVRNWSGIAGVSIIDVIPQPPEGDVPELQDTGRAIAVHTFRVLTRDALPGSYGPTI